MPNRSNLNESGNGSVRVKNESGSENESENGSGNQSERFKSVRAESGRKSGSESSSCLS